MRTHEQRLAAHLAELREWCDDQTLEALQAECSDGSGCSWDREQCTAALLDGAAEYFNAYPEDLAKAQGDAQ